MLSLGFKLRYIHTMKSKPPSFVIYLTVLFVILTGCLLTAAYLFSKGLFLSHGQPKVTFQMPYQGQSLDFPQTAAPLNIFYFGYTSCPDVCPLTLTYLSQAIKTLSAADQQKIQVIFVSVDYAHDTPEKADQYAKSFLPQFKGLTGSQEQIDALINQFHGSYVIEKNEKSYLGYSISHTDRLFFVNQKGEILQSLLHAQSIQTITPILKESL